MTRIRDISEIDSFHPTVDQAEKAFNQMVKREFTMHVPPEFEDADIVLGRVIAEWKEYKQRYGIDAVEYVPHTLDPDMFGDDEE